jgi:hypothetical protein
MTRSNLVLGGVAGLALVLAGILFFENQALEDELASARRATAVAEAATAAGGGDPWGDGGGFEGSGPRSAQI